MNEKDDPRSFGNMPYRPSEGGQLPPWMQADKISPMEKLEITMYKVVTYIPVAITFGVFAFLFTFYTAVSIFFFLIRAIFSFFSTLQLMVIFTGPLDSQTCGKTHRKWMKIC